MTAPASRRAPGTTGARFLLATRWIDRAQLAFDRIRSELVTGLASDAVLDRFNDLVYTDAGGYDPDDPAFRSYLFPWEDEVLERWVAAPPASILVGGGGSGRETFALLALGYDVVTFDPSAGLIGMLAKRITADMRLRVFRAAYEDLPVLRDPSDGAVTRDLAELGPFDASILGWGSYSHLRTTDQRVETLRRFAAVTNGPIVVSFLHLGERHRGNPRRLASLRRWLRARHDRTEGDAFSIYIGFYHVFDGGEIRDLAGRAGLEVRHLSEPRDSWPYAVLAKP